MYEREAFINIAMLMYFMKCEICNKNIGETFLGKILGTIVKDEKGKKHTICFECQKKFQTKEKALVEIKK